MAASNVHRLDDITPPAGAPHARWVEDLVVEAGADGRLDLRATGPARSAASCLLAPCAGDRVLVAVTASGAFVALVLTRGGTQTAHVGVPGARHLAIVQERITLTAEHELRLQSVRDMAITSAAGTLRMSAQHLFLTVTGSLVENLRHHVAQVGSYALQVKELLRMSARHALVSAEKDLKMDAQRIDLG